MKVKYDQEVEVCGSTDSERSKWSRKLEGATRCGLLSDRHDKQCAVSASEEVASAVWSVLVETASKV